MNNLDTLFWNFHQIWTPVPISKSWLTPSRRVCFCMSRPRWVYMYIRPTYVVNNDRTTQRCWCNEWTHALVFTYEHVVNATLFSIRMLSAMPKILCACNNYLKFWINWINYGWNSWNGKHATTTQFFSFAHIYSFSLLLSLGVGAIEYLSNYATPILKYHVLFNVCFRTSTTAVLKGTLETECSFICVVVRFRIISAHNMSAL